mmetsp:Transcript_15819/g.38907  ORF Transcript_15819/g.38907 Transcript_15819/m.38907 type:complete len:228 (-) Transcript_15819:34-717(-)
MRPSVAVTRRDSFTSAERSACAASTRPAASRRSCSRSADRVADCSVCTLVIRARISVLSTSWMPSRSAASARRVSLLAPWSLSTDWLICPRSLPSRASLAAFSSRNSPATSVLTLSTERVMVATAATRCVCSSRIAFSTTNMCSIVFWRSFWLPFWKALICSFFSRTMAWSRSTAPSLESTTRRLTSATRCSISCSRRLITATSRWFTSSSRRPTVASVRASASARA